MKEKSIDRKTATFLPGAPFSGVFQEALCVHRTDANFPGRFVCSPNRYNFPGGCGLFTEQIPFFQEPSLCVHRTDTEQIPIFQEPSLCVHRTDTNFPGAPF